MADTAKLGQVGPKVGSVDAGWGTAFLARHVGDKKAREIWYLNLQYSGQEALELGLVNNVVPADELDRSEERRGGKEGVRTCGYRWWRENQKTKQKKEEAIHKAERKT